MTENPAPDTVLHLLRHGEVYNPGGVLYGRLPDFHLSEEGRLMAKATAGFLAGRDVVLLRSSPLDRTLETSAPLAAQFELPVHTDDRLIEPTNVFEGTTVGVGSGALRNPVNWRYLYNPFRPSWGEPYRDIATRMLAAMADAARAARGHEAVLVSHQLPIWIARRAAEGTHLWHNPAHRQCALASVTSFSYTGDEITGVSYAEPATAASPHRVLERGPARCQPRQPYRAQWGAVLLAVGAISVSRPPHATSRVTRPGRAARLGLLAAVSALAVSGCAGGAIAANTPASNGQSFVSGSPGTTLFQAGHGPAAPAVSGPLVGGGRLSLTAYRGHVVVLNFWGSWCTPCREEAPSLAQLARQYGRSGVRFLGIDIRDSPASAEAFMSDFRISYPSLNDPSDNLALDFRDTVPPAGIPTTLVISRTGRIAARVIGGVTYDGLKSLIQRAVAEPG